MPRGYEGPEAPMFYYLFIGLAALAAACSPTQTTDPTTVPPPKNKPEEEPLGQNFGDDTQARERYLKLKALGVHDAQMDVGCSVFQYLEDGQTLVKILGKGDRKPLQACETDEFILDHYDDPRFRRLAEEVTGGPVPWALDDYDDKTQDDAELRTKLQKVINHLDTLLKGKGLQRGQPAYQEAMGLGLTAYLGTPPMGFGEFQKTYHFQNSLEENAVHGAIAGFKNEISEKGLGEFWDSLEKEGGVRLNDGNLEKELSALEAIRANQGECTENSKILYGALRMAGLDPFFNFVDFWNLEDGYIGAFLRENPNLFHINVGLRIENTTRIFDPTLLESPEVKNGSLPVSLRQYLAMDFNNRGSIFKKNQEFSLAEKNLTWASHLDPSSVLPLINLAEGFGNNRDPNKALEIIDHALQLKPQSATAYMIRGLAQFELGKTENALKDFNRAISIDSRDYHNFLIRGISFLKIQKQQDGERDFVVALQLAPQNAGKELLENFLPVFKDKWEHTSEKKTLNLIKNEVQLDPAKCEALFYLASFYWRAGQREYCLGIVNEFVQTLLPIRESLAKKKKEFSPEVLNYIAYLKQALPPKFWGDYEVKPLWESLKLPS
jgi:tetratricopeptide (TPR) repeat protein